MTRYQARELVRLVCLCTAVWATSHSTALAEALETAATEPGPPMGHGFAYLFGFGGGLVLFIAKLLTAKSEQPTESAK